MNTGKTSIKDVMDNIFKGKNLEKITLDSVFTDRQDILDNHVNILNSVSLTVASIMSIVLCTFWLMFGLFVSNDQGVISLFGIIGLVLMICASIAMLIILARTENKSSNAFGNSLLFFHIAFEFSIMFLTIAQSDMIKKTGIGTIGGIPLSNFMLIILLFVQLKGKKRCLISAACLAITEVIPVFINGIENYPLAQHIIIALSLYIGYIAFDAITRRSAAVIADLANASYRDYQTQALNSRALTETLSTLDRNECSTVGLMIFDIDDFKQYNDEYSHAMGDRALTRICEKTMQILHEEKSRVFRYSNSEFVAIIKDPTDKELLHIALRIRDAVESLHIEKSFDSWLKYLTITVGCAIATAEEAKAMDILGEADSQLCIGQHGTKNCVVFKGRIYVAEGEITIDQQPTQYTERVAQAINQAMETGEIKAYYQPLYNTKTHEIVGAEALSRWVKPDGTVILPGEFVPELEKNSSIIELDWYLYTEVCRMLRKQREEGIPQVRISVNFSRMHALYERSIEKRLCEIADQYGIPHELIEIEITESAYIHLPNIIEPFIKNIRAEGFSVAVDDFGSGASSLVFVKSVDVDTLKIDRSLITTNFSDEKDRVLLESVVYLAHRLQLNSVAEGVETQEQLGLLKTLGCNQIQGFIFSLPMPEDEFLEVCKNQGAVDVSLDPERHLCPSSSLQMLLSTIFRRYPVVIMANVTRNSFYTLAYTGFTKFKYTQAGTMSELMDELCTTMHPDDVKEFMNLNSRENLIRQFAEGKDKIISADRLREPDENGTYRQVYNVTYLLKEKGSDDLLAVIFCTNEETR